MVRSSRLILPVTTSRSASIVHDCGAELFTRIGGEEQVLFQISSQHCLVSAHVCNAGKSTFMLSQNWNNLQATVRRPWRSLFFFAGAHDQRESEVVEPLGPLHWERPKTRGLSKKTSWVAQTSKCARVTTLQDNPTEEIVIKNAVPNQSPTFLLISFPRSAHFKCHHFAPSNTTHQSHVKGDFVRTLDTRGSFLYGDGVGAHLR